MAPLESSLPFVFLRVSQQQWSHQRVMRGLFIIIKWIDQRSLHVQKCNDRANEIVPLLPSRRPNYIVRGHGELTAMGRFSMTRSWVRLSRCTRIFHHHIFFYYFFFFCGPPPESTSFLSSLLSFSSLQKWLECEGRNRTAEVCTVWEQARRLHSCDAAFLFVCFFFTLSSSVLIDKKKNGHYLLGSIERKEGIVRKQIGMFAQHPAAKMSSGSRSVVQCASPAS